MYLEIVLLCYDETMDESLIPAPELEQEALSVDLAKPDDAQQLAEILNQSAQYKLAHGDDAWASVPFTVEELNKHISKGNTYTARLGDTIVGTLMLLWEDEMVWGKQPPDAAYVHLLAVKDGHHGHNLGGQLLDWTSEQAVSNGKKVLRIDLPPENDGLKAYYEKQGFKWVEDKEVHAPHATYTAALYEKPTS